MGKWWVVALLAAPFAVGPTRAEVQSAGPGGFLIHHEALIAAPQASVYGRLVQIGAWWSSQHSYSGDARNMTLEVRPGGCFCERWAGGEVEHMRVAHHVGGSSLRLLGGLGPLQGSATGALTFTLIPDGSRTRLTVDYQVWGYDPAGLAAMSAPVDAVLGEQVARLKTYAEGP